jgi:DNA modification methylase
MTVRIIQADVMDGLRQLPSESVHCVVTSPPYWGLRDYGVEGQIGSEPTLLEHIDRLVAVFGEIRRVLRADGTLWLNYGDAYAGSWGAQSRGETPGPASKLSGRQVYAAPRGINTGSLKRTPGLKPKDLMGLPWRLAFALQDDGWWLRSDIIWSKPNPMPESIRDRPTKSHEYVFLMTKSERYFYDADAVREMRSGNEDAMGFRGGSYVGGTPGPRTQIGNKRVGKNETIKLPERRRGHERKHQGFNERWDSMGRAEQMANGRNRRSVWTIATAPFAEAHFATFPPELPEICIKAGCPKGGMVLDPFGGSGTTALVADRLQRNAILIELNPEYAAMAERRLGRDRGGLLDVMEHAE